MKNVRPWLAVALVVAGACQIFEDPTPERIFFRMTGPPGASVRAIYSRDFIAGTNELGGTQVEVFGRDTVFHTFPIDTVFDIRSSSQWFVQVSSADTVAVSVTIDVDDRNLLSAEGGIFPEQPWRYVYQFNQFLGEVVEVVF